MSNHLVNWVLILIHRVPLRPGESLEQIAGHGVEQLLQRGARDGSGHGLPSAGVVAAAEAEDAAVRAVQQERLW